MTRDESQFSRNDRASPSAAADAPWTIPDPRETLPSMHQRSLPGVREGVLLLGLATTAATVSCGTVTERAVSPSTVRVAETTDRRPEADVRRLHHVLRDDALVVTIRSYPVCEMRVVEERTHDEISQRRLGGPGLYAELALVAVGVGLLAYAQQYSCSPTPPRWEDCNPEAVRAGWRFWGVTGLLVGGVPLAVDVARLGETRTKHVERSPRSATVGECGAPVPQRGVSVGLVLEPEWTVTGTTDSAGQVVLRFARPPRANPRDGELVVEGKPVGRIPLGPTL